MPDMNKQLFAWTFLLFSVQVFCALKCVSASAVQNAAFSNWETPNFEIATKRSKLDEYYRVYDNVRPLAFVATCEQSHLRYVQQSLYKHLGYGFSSEPENADLLVNIFPYPCKLYDGKVKRWNSKFHYAYPQWFESPATAKSPLRTTPGVHLDKLMATKRNPEVHFPTKEEGHKMLRALHSKLLLCENAQEIASKYLEWQTAHHQEDQQPLPISSRTMVKSQGWTAPPCIVLPTQLERGKIAAQDAGLATEWPLWVHKTDGSYLGAGVLSLSPLSTIVKAYEEKQTFYRPAAMARPGLGKDTKLERTFASAYMKHPFLYKDVSGGVEHAVKTDFRTWALVAGTFPPRVYIFKQGLFRSAEPSAAWDVNATDKQLMQSFKTNKAQHVTNAVATKKYLVTSINGRFDAFANTGPLLPQYAEVMERDGIHANQSLHDARMASAYVFVNQFHKKDCLVSKQLCNRHFVTGFADIGLSSTGEVFLFEMAMHTIYKNRPGDTYGKDPFMGGNLMHAFWSTRALAGATHIGGGKLHKECQTALRAAAAGSEWSDQWLASTPSPLEAASSQMGESRADILSNMCAEKVFAANLEVDDVISGAATSPSGKPPLPLWQRDTFLRSLLRNDHLEMLQAFEDLLGDFYRSHPLYLEIGGLSFT
jgi:hypothetical protein